MSDFFFSLIHQNIGQVYDCLQIFNKKEIILNPIIPINNVLTTFNIKLIFLKLQFQV